MRRPELETLPLPFEEPHDSDRLIHELKSRIGKEVHLTLTQNRVSMVHFRHEGSLVRLRLHEAMREMPENIIDSLARWIRKPGRQGAPKLIRDYIRDLPTEIHQRRRSSRVIRPVGRVHDLSVLTARVNREYFEGLIDARVTWGRDSSDKRVRVRRLGSYQRGTNTIVIHPVLDDIRVPEAIVSFTLFHEMLHALQPETQKRHHDKAFREAEQAHPDYDSVQTWMKKNTRLLNGGRGRKFS